MSQPQGPQPRPDLSPGTPEPQPMGEATGPQPQRVAVRLPLYRPVVTWALLAIIVVVFLVETMLGGSTDVDVLIQMGAKYTPLIAAGEYWRLFTSMFLHVGVMHLAFNGYALFIIGIELERLVGPGRFLSIYLLSGLFGSLASYALSDSLAAGASGAIFGIIGAQAAFFLVHRERLGSWGTRRLGSIALVLVINLVWGFSQPGRIDNLAHVGGLLAGVALGWALSPRYELDSVRMKVVDRNQLGRYWPALGLAVLLLLGGTALVTAGYRDSPRSHLYRGQQAIEEEQWDEAAAELEQAISQDPSLADASVYFNLGLARNYLEQPQEAIAAYQKALELDPDQAASHWNLAMTFLELERYADARASLEAYAELTPSGPVEVRPYLDELESLGY
jgi:rhomboid protease GluP